VVEATDGVLSAVKSETVAMEAMGMAVAMWLG